jgi:hypothetical protein
MNVNIIKQFCNKKVLLVMKGGQRVTVIIPNDLSEETLVLKDKFGLNTAINISLIENRV